VNADWAAFTPAAGTVGGLLIGTGAVLLMLGAGRIAGISGILGGLFAPERGGGWRVAFLLGMFAAPWLYRLFSALPSITVDASMPRLIIAGLLVGLGTRYAAGCTSGHGVCGLSRGSRRSLAATALFMAAGFATVYLLRHVAGG